MTTGLVPGGWGLNARRCDTCRTAAALIYCRADAAFLCGACDGKLHDLNQTRTRLHERVWVCEVCEQAPAVVTCKADAAALCTACDRDIHAANPLAGRHERVPVVPFLHTAADAAVRPSAFLTPDDIAAVPPAPVSEVDDVDADAWLIPNPSTKVLMADFLYNDSDLLDFGYDSQNLEKSGGNERFESGNFAFTDSVVPTQSKGTLSFSEAAKQTFENSFDIDFSQPNKHQKHNHQILSAFNYSAQPSISSSDIGVVPDANAANSISEVSYTFTKSVSSASAAPGDGVPSAASGSPAPAMDREARVLRYREKRKNRKFAKTIRYASRKAYAEKRPRIKGRFAKRSETAEVSELEQIYGLGSGSGSLRFALDNSGFGVVPFFD